MFVCTLAVTLVLVTLAGCASHAEIARRNAIEDDRSVSPTAPSLANLRTRRAGRRWMQPAPKPGP
jgi:hypothetical protein